VLATAPRLVDNCSSTLYKEESNNLEPTLSLPHLSIDLSARPPLVRST
jgi:hypothetical protein